MVSAVSGASSSLWTLEKQSASSLANSIFATVDTENKGYIDKAALTSALSGSDASSSDLDDVFAELDQDSDGKITRNELSSSIDQLSQALAAQFSQSRVDSARNSAGNGGDDPGFTREELTAIAADDRTDAAQSALMTKLAENFDAADTDADGRINGEEAMAYDKLTSTDGSTATATAGPATQGAGGPPPAGGGGSSSGTTYAAADTNEDGTVSLQELVAYEIKQGSSADSDTASSSTSNDTDAAKRLLAQLVQAYGLAERGGDSTVAASESLSAYA